MAEKKEKIVGDAPIKEVPSTPVNDKKAEKKAAKAAKKQEKIAADLAVRTELLEKLKSGELTQAQYNLAVAKRTAKKLAVPVLGTVAVGGLIVKGIVDATSGEENNDTDNEGDVEMTSF